MARSLSQQAADLDRALAELVARYQFRDRNETVAYGLSVSQSYALRALDGRGALAMGELATALRLSVSTMTRVVDPLVRKKLVARVRGEADRRVCEVALTRAGRALWRRIRNELVASDREVLRRISPGERDTVIRVIRDLSRAVDVWRAQKAQEAS